MAALKYLILMLPLVLAAPVQLQNITILAPVGTSNHSDPHLLCTPTRPQDVLIFFLGNYFAHVATVRVPPGTPVLPTILILVYALLFPVAGLGRGINAIFRAAIFKKTSLETAVKAGAVYHVVRIGSWRPHPGDLVRGVQLNTTVYTSPSSPVTEHLEDTPDGPDGLQNLHTRVALRVGFRDQVYRPWYTRSQKSWEFDRVAATWKDWDGLKVHGRCDLPPGYGLAPVEMNKTIYELKAVETNHWESQAQEYDDDRKPGRVSAGGANTVEHGLQEMDDEIYVSASSVAQSTRNKLPKRIEKNTNGMDQDHGSRAMNDSSSGNVSPRASGARDDLSFELSSMYSFAKASIAVIQLIYACLTIVRTRGDQTARYGYAAFGLTVTPYLIMSFMNGLGSMLTPDYSRAYIVWSEIMEEAVNRKGCFEGMIGTLCSQGAIRPAGETDAEKLPRTSTVDDACFDARFGLRGDQLTMRPLTDSDMVVRRGSLNDDGSYDCQWCELPTGPAAFSYIELDISLPPHETYKANLVEEQKHKEMVYNIVIWIGLVPLALLGVLTGFKKGRSSKAERGWTMAWLIVSSIYGMVDLQPSIEDAAKEMILKRFVLLFGCGAPAIGGMVVVGKMLMEYGNCIRMY